MTDYDSEALEVVRRSAIVSALDSIRERFVAAVGSSSVMHAVRVRARALHAVSLAARIRLAGIVALTGILTHEVLALFVPAQVASATTFALPVTLAIAAIFVIVAAPLLAKAWQSRSNG